VTLHTFLTLVLHGSELLGSRSGREGKKPFSKQQAVVFRERSQSSRNNS